MLRLAVISLDEATLQAASPRLRGAKVFELNSDDRLSSPLESCDAIVLTGWKHGGRDCFDRCLIHRKPLMLICDCCSARNGLDEWSAATQRFGVSLTIANPDRHLPSRMLIRQQLDAGKFGAPGLVRSHRWEPPSATSSDTDGVLPASLLRDIDLTLWLMGPLPNSIFAVGQDVRFVQVHLGFPGGGMALLDFTSQLPAGDEYQSLSLIGSTGAAYADDHHNRSLLFQGGRSRAALIDEGIKATTAMLQDFVDSLSSNRDPSPSITAWRNTLQVADAVRQSLGSGQPVAFEDR